MRLLWLCPGNEARVHQQFNGLQWEMVRIEEAKWALCFLPSHELSFMCSPCPYYSLEGFFWNDKGTIGLVEDCILLEFWIVLYLQISLGSVILNFKSSYGLGHSIWCGSTLFALISAVFCSFQCISFALNFVIFISKYLVFLILGL